MHSPQQVSAITILLNQMNRCVIFNFMEAHRYVVTITSIQDI